jgi:hypothetical protein
VCQHHRKVGTAQSGPIKANFTTGVMDYAMGNHPLWELFRSAYQMTRKPYLVRGIALGMGYIWSYVRGVKRPVSREFMRFHRREQMQRLKNKVTGKGVSVENYGAAQGKAHETR